MHHCPFPAGQHGKVIKAIETHRHVGRTLNRQEAHSEFPACPRSPATTAVRRRYIETLERPSQHHASSGTQTMSLQCNLRRHLLHKSSTPATHKVKGSTGQHVQGIKRSYARPRKHRLTCQPSMLRQAVPTSKQPCQARHLHPTAASFVRSVFVTKRTRGAQPIPC
jgi:hypothetical protein